MSFVEPVAPRPLWRKTSALLSFIDEKLFLIGANANTVVGFETVFLFVTRPRRWCLRPGLTISGLVQAQSRRLLRCGATTGWTSGGWRSSRRPGGGSGRGPWLMPPSLRCRWSKWTLTGRPWNGSPWSWLEQGLMDLQDTTRRAKIE